MTLQRLKYLFSFSGFLSAMYFSIPIWMVFLTTRQHFSVETAINLSVLEGAMIAIFEVWSGSWSDRFGRRKIFAIGGALQMGATMIYILGSGLPIFLISALLAGIGGAMMSGNIEAIIHDRLRHTGKESSFTQMQSQSYMWLFIGRTFGAITGGYLFLYNPIFPYIGNLVVFALYTGMIFFFPKDEQVKSSAKNDLEHILVGLGHLWGQKQVFSSILLILLASSLGNIYWFTYQEYFHILGLPLEYFGWLYAVTSAVSGISAWVLSQCIEKRISRDILLTFLMILLMISSLFFAFSTSLWSLIGLVTLSFMFGWIMTLGNTLMLESTKDTHKSMAVSLFSLMMTLGYIIFTFVAGYSISLFGLETIYMSLAWIYAGTTLLIALFYARSWYLKKRPN